MNEAIERTIAQLPSRGQKIRVIFDTDIDNEIDDGATPGPAGVDGRIFARMQAAAGS